MPEGLFCVRQVFWSWASLPSGGNQGGGAAGERPVRRARESPESRGVGERALGLAQARTCARLPNAASDL